jgi:hypothetical protein
MKMGRSGLGLCVAVCVLFASSRKHNKEVFLFNPVGSGDFLTSWGPISLSRKISCLEVVR